MQVPTLEWQPRLNRVRRPGSANADASFENESEPDAYALERRLRLKRAAGRQSVVWLGRPARFLGSDPRGRSQPRRGSAPSMASIEALASADGLSSSPTLWRCYEGRAVRSLAAPASHSAIRASRRPGVLLGERLGLPHATIIMACRWRAGGALVSSASSKAAGPGVAMRFPPC